MAPSALPFAQSNDNFQGIGATIEQYWTRVISLTQLLNHLNPEGRWKWVSQND